MDKNNFLDFTPNKKRLSLKKEKEIKKKGLDPKIVEKLLYFETDEGFNHFLQIVNHNIKNGSKVKISDEIIIKSKDQSFSLFVNNIEIFYNFTFILYLYNKNNIYWFYANKVNSEKCLLNSNGECFIFPYSDDIELYTDLYKVNYFVLYQNDKITFCHFDGKKFDKIIKSPIFYKDFDFYKINKIKPFLILKKKNNGFILPWNYEENRYMTKEEILNNKDTFNYFSL